MAMNNNIRCPKCGTDIDIKDAIYHQLEGELKENNVQQQQKLQQEVESKRREYKEALGNLESDKNKLEAAKEDFAKNLAQATEDQVAKQLKQARQEIERRIQGKIEAEKAEQLRLLSEELAEKSEQVKQLNVSKAEIEKLKREKSEIESQVKMKAEQALTAALQTEKNKLEAQLHEVKNQATKEAQVSVALALKAKDEQIMQMTKSIEDAKRKSQQGSMQIQGESLETAIEDWLESQFAFDTVEEVKKGAFGADCVQTIHTRTLQNCGVICYESKNTKAWSDAWVTKLKQDMLKVKADLGVIVTSVYPNDMDRMGFVEGIWVCSLEEFKGAAALLRAGLIQVHQTLQKEDNKTDKMSLLYAYLTGNEFTMQLNAIVDGFMSMQSELDKERRSLMASWKRRQKTIDGVLQNTTEMYGALQGIAGSAALGKIAALELDDE